LNDVLVFSFESLLLNLSFVDYKIWEKVVEFQENNIRAGKKYRTEIMSKGASAIYGISQEW